MIKAKLDILKSIPDDEFRGLAVITGASIHLLAIFYKNFAKTGDKKSALRFAMRHSGFAIVILTIVKATVIIGRTTPEMRLNIKAKIKITMSSIFWIKLRVSFFIACLITQSLVPFH
jgi:hypothetical protein